MIWRKLKVKPNSQLKTDLSNFEDVFSVLSLDDSKTPNVSMYSNPKKAIHFDKVKDNYFSSFNSCDALMINSSDIVFVEFKNGCLEFTQVQNDKNKEDHRKCANRNMALELYLKISESVLLLSHLSDALFSDISSKVSFILVYNDKANPKVKIHAHTSQLACKQSWLGITGRYSNKLLKDVKLMTVNEFDKFVSNF